MVLELALLVLPLFLPGYVLVNALFPARGSLGGDLDAVYRLFLAVLLSVALTAALGTLLVVLSAGERVLFLPSILWPVLAALTTALFLVGVLRGGYPWLQRLLGREAASEAAWEGGDHTRLDRLAALTEELAGARRAEDEGRVRRLEAEKRRLEEEAASEWR